MGWIEDRRPYVRAHRNDFDELFSEQANLVTSIWQQLDQPLAVASIFDRLRWDRALRERIYLRNHLTATELGAVVAEAFGIELDSTEFEDLLDNSARLSAENINAVTEEHLQAALVAEEPEDALDSVFALLRGHRLAVVASSTVAFAANVGRSTAAEQGGARTKTWRVNSKNPRSSHKAMDGQKVGIDELFSNGMKWPGDPVGDADEVANCRCSVEFES